MGGGALVYPLPTQCSIHLNELAAVSVCLSVRLSLQDVLLLRGMPQDPLDDIVQVLLNLGMVRKGLNAFPLSTKATGHILMTVVTCTTPSPPTPPPPSLPSCML